MGATGAVAHACFAYWLSQSYINLFATKDIIGKKRKILFSKLFYQKVVNNEIKKNQLQPSTIKSFEEVFKWIGEKF